MRGGFDRDRAARILVDAVQYGDRKTSERWQVHVKTIENYRKRLSKDQALIDLFQQKAREAETGWHLTRTRFLRNGIEKLEALIGQAKVDQLEEVSRAIERIGNLDVASKVLDVGTHAYQPRPSDAADSGSDPEGEDPGPEGGDEGLGPDAGH